MATNGRNIVFHWLLCFIFFTIPCFSVKIAGGASTLVQGQLLTDGEYLVSKEGTFRLGFFSPGTSSNRYLGISYNTPAHAAYPPVKKVVWVANRNTPIHDSSGILHIDEYGKLKISCSGSDPVVLSSVPTVSNVSATLFDSGNFVLRELNADGTVRRILWQSFDHPTDTLLPGMKLGINFRTGQTTSLTSWISRENPAPGSFTFGGDPNGTNQLIVQWQENVFWISGLWQNGSFEFAPQLTCEKNKTFSYISNENEKYFMFHADRSATPSKYTIEFLGVISEYRRLAPFFLCSLGIKAQAHGCEYLERRPKCSSRAPYFPHLRKGYVSSDGFRFDGSQNWSIIDCRAKCLPNCSCIAFASINEDGTGCEIWNYQEMDFTESDDLKGREIHFLQHIPSSTKAKRRIWPIVAGAAVIFVIVFCFSCYFIFRKYKLAETDVELQLLHEQDAPALLRKSRKKNNLLTGDGRKSEKLQFFSYESIAYATNNFSNVNKLGEGGFGPVFKGRLATGQHVAIKRLSKNSEQGVEEFKNEVRVTANLQHTNIVKLLGCCIQQQEKMLIYEFMPNKSLNFFLFDPEKKHTLDWKKRLHIIEGIAQGLLYLHKYSRLRIIHRDLKASNILLDCEMNPKISDFGMARIMEPNECQTKTTNIVGTYGYMSPEFAMEGIFSTKSDVFSFGVLLLEIVSCKKNTRICQLDSSLDLIGYAWELWREGRGLELMDSSLSHSLNQSREVLRCIHVGLLCVEENPIDRPSTLDVIAMIYNEGYQLPSPKQPAFRRRMDSLEVELAKCMPENCSM